MAKKKKKKINKEGYLNFIFSRILGRRLNWIG